MIRSFSAVLLAIGTAVAAVAFATPASAGGHKTECSGSFRNQTFHGGVVVKAGDICNLTNVTITGGLTITGGHFDVDHSTIKGGWRITGGTALNPAGRGDLCANNVDGGIRVIPLKLKNVADVRSTERIYRLVVVANDAQVPVLLRQQL